MYDQAFSIAIPCATSIAIVDAMPCPSNPGIWYIPRINVPQHSRNQGMGTELMRKLCLRADSEGLTLYVYPTENYASNLARLRRFFVRFGFFSDATYGGTGAFTRIPNEKVYVSNEA
jgi:hypothetical protein